MHQGCVCALNAQPSDAIRLITSGMETRELTGATLWIPFFLSHLARAYAAIDNFEGARRSIHEAITTVERIKEGWCEAEVYRTAGEIMLLSSKRDAAKAEAYFSHGLKIAASQKAKTWELRSAMGMARLWRDQGKCDEAYELLAPIYGWFTEGFATRDLKDAKALWSYWSQESVKLASKGARHESETDNHGEPICGQSRIPKWSGLDRGPVRTWGERHRDQDRQHDAV
jgi:predicted ATPase